MFMVRFTFTIFTHVILVHWRVILITCKMTCEEFANYTQKSRIATEYGAHEYQNKTECTTATLYVANHRMSSFTHGASFFLSLLVIVARSLHV